MKKIKRINPSSLAKVLGTLYVLFGFIGGIVFLIIAVFFGGFDHSPKAEAVIFGVAAPVFLPILYGIIGAVAGFVIAFFYNLVAKWTGGIELDIE